MRDHWVDMEHCKSTDTCNFTIFVHKNDWGQQKCPRKWENKIDPSHDQTVRIHLKCAYDLFFSLEMFCYIG